MLSQALLSSNINSSPLMAPLVSPFLGRTLQDSMNWKKDGAIEVS